MADNNAYVFTFKNETETGKKKNPVAGNGAEPKEGSGSQSSSRKAAIAKGIVVYRTAKSFVDQAVTHNISTVSLRTGAEELQERLAFAREMTQKGLNIVESVAFGALVGNAAGAIIGLMTSVSHTVISYAQKAETLRLERSVENASLHNMAIRAGGSLATFSGSRGKRQ